MSIARDLAPMEAKLVAELPEDDGWQFEPKWDGFRALVFRNGEDIEILSKSGKSLVRYFPEIVAMVAGIGEDQFVLDGELILPIGDVLSFDALQARLHPAESRIRKLSQETPAQLMLFDCLQHGGRDLIARTIGERRAALEAFHDRHGGPSLLLSPWGDLEAARSWLAQSGGALDGVVAKRTDEVYRPGKRAMIKVKQHRTADCVVGGFRRAKDGKGVASLLLELYDDAGRLNHVGFTSSIAAGERVELAERLEPLIDAPGFTGKAPSGPSRWNAARRASGSRCAVSWSSRCCTTKSPVRAFDTALGYCGGDPTRLRHSARCISSSTSCGPLNLRPWTNNPTESRFA